MLARIYYNQAIRYCVVGAANTAVTAIVILAMTAYGLGLYTANIAGYVIGILLSFALNTYFTFASKPSISRLVKFIACCMACYAINLAAMSTSQFSGIENIYLIQIIGMFFYTASGYLINKCWVMK